MTAYDSCMHRTILKGFSKDSMMLRAFCWATVRRADLRTSSSSCNVSSKRNISKYSFIWNTENKKHFLVIVTCMNMLLMSHIQVEETTSR